MTAVQSTEKIQKIIETAEKIIQKFTTTKEMTDSAAVTVTMKKMMI